MTQIERLNKYVVVGECWIWTAALISGRYGTVKHDGKMWLAHRLFYTLCVGEIPVGLHIHHTCHNSRCVNPEHLSLMNPGDHARVHVRDNLGDSWRRRASATHCHRGHEFTVENTRYTPIGRKCRACQRFYMAEARAKSRRKLCQALSG